MTKAKSKSRTLPRRRELAHAVMMALALAGALGAANVQAAAVYPLSGLNGANGVRLDGVAAGDGSSGSVAAAGDVNGDGIGDIIVGANFATSNGIGGSGASYVVFGRSSAFASTINLSSLNGTTGFRLDGVGVYDRSGFSVAAAGDVNGDGIDDVIVGAVLADPNGIDSGSSYVVFGRSTGFASTINLSSLDGATGFRLDGVAANDQSGSAVAAAGDVNRDGIDDVIVGADRADPNGDYSGSSYVVFGRSTAFASTINLSSLNGTTGFRLDGAAAFDYSGRAVAAADDVNGDGIDDVIVGASLADPNGNDSGSSYVVFGRSTGFASTINLSSLNGATGFRLDGVAADDYSGHSVAAAGDVNGDGIADVIVGAYGADLNGSYSGASYVVFGRSTAFASTINLSSLDGATGFRLDGVAAGDRSGRSVAAAGDVNGDGMADVIVGAHFADPNGNNSGASYVVFGRSTAFASTINFSTLDGASGFRLDGVAADDYSGRSVAAAGDANGDGIDDVIVGAYGADPNGSDSGATYVVFGNAAPLVSSNGPAPLTAVFEDTASPTGTRVDTAALSFYLDIDPIAGAGLTATPVPTSNGTWQYSFDAGASWQDVPAGLSTTNALVLLAASQLRFVPAADFFGISTTLSVRLWDGADGYTAGTGRNIAASIGSRGGFSNDANLVGLVAPITPVNDAPTFVASDPAPVRNDAGLVQIPSWVTAIDPGPNEGAQAIQSFVVSNVTNPSLFATPPQVLVDRTLRFQPAAGAAGTSQFTVRVQDNGGTANGGIDTSAPQNFTITVRATADALFANGFEG